MCIYWWWLWGRAYWPKLTSNLHTCHIIWYSSNWNALDGWVSPRASNAHAHILNACACAFDGIGYVRQGELRSMLYGNWVMSSEKALFNFKSRCTVETQLGSPTQPPTSKWPLYLTASPIFTPHIICSTHRLLWIVKEWRCCVCNNIFKLFGWFYDH